MKGESISRILFSPDPSFQKEGNGIRSPTGNPDEQKRKTARAKAWGLLAFSIILKI
jgi:hypothetical protein